MFLQGYEELTEIWPQGSVVHASLRIAKSQMQTRTSADTTRRITSALRVECGASVGVAAVGLRVREFVPLPAPYGQNRAVGCWVKGRVQTAQQQNITRRWTSTHRIVIKWLETPLEPCYVSWYYRWLASFSRVECGFTVWVHGMDVTSQRAVIIWNPVWAQTGLDLLAYIHFRNFDCYYWRVELVHREERKKQYNTRYKEEINWNRKENEEGKRRLQLFLCVGHLRVAWTTSDERVKNRQIFRLGTRQPKTKISHRKREKDTTIILVSCCHDSLSSAGRLKFRWGMDLSDTSTKPSENKAAENHFLNRCHS